MLRGGVLVGASSVSGYVGYRWPRPEPAPAEPPPAVRRFVSRPDLTPPTLTVSYPTPGMPRSPGYVMLAPKGYARTGPGQQGPMIVDRAGRLVWFLPLTRADQTPMGLAVQQYRGHPVLTWWQGTITGDGHGVGEGVVYDSGYNHIATVQAGNGARADLHEFNLTSRGTALLLIYRPTRADLSVFGGSSFGWVYAGVVQEVDVATGAVLFEWDSMAQIPVEHTYFDFIGGTAQAPFDYLHLNSVAEDPDGDLLLSGRNTSTIYKLSRATGQIVWRIGGRASDFDVTPPARFFWQHDARMTAPGRLSVFDNSSSPPRAAQSRALLLDVDTARRRVSLAHQYTHPAGLLSDNQGSVQTLPDGRIVVGWGAQPYVSQFDPGGRLMWDARLPANDQSYRAFASDWVATPAEPPALVVGPNDARGATVYVSWNGATQVTQWRVLAGSEPTSLTPVATATVTRFETATAVTVTGPWFAAVALDHLGREIGRSAPVFARLP